MLHKPESRLKSRDRQDRSVTHKNYARTTDKGFQNGRIYSLISRNNQQNETRANTNGQGKVDSSTTVLSIAAMQTMLTQATVDNDSPTVAVATRSIYDLYYNLKLHEVEKSSLIDLEARQGDKAQAFNYAA